MKRAAVVAEFETPEAMLEGAKRLREHGYAMLDGFTPFPVPGAELAFGFRRSKLPYVVLFSALVGAGLAYLFQAWTVSVDYPLDVGGRPPYSPPVYVPITFEMGVLFAAFSALIAMLALAGLPRLWDPLFEVAGFETASVDKFWIAVGRDDPRFDREVTATLLLQLGALRVLDVPEETS